jgi:hypothetical protein
MIRNRAHKDSQRTKRRDTKLECEGAEFLVLGNLLIDGIQCFKSYVNFPGYDLFAVNPKTKRVARIQIKSRWASDYDHGFPIKNFDSDFVVHVALNRGYGLRKKGLRDDKEVRQPEFYVIPTKLVKKAQRPNDWNKVFLRHIPKHRQYLGAWQLIRNFLAS